jgi:FkbM family methyltransferase
MATEQEQAAVIRALAGTERPVIVDLGAHHGEEYLWMDAKLGPLGAYIAVEADPRNCEWIRNHQPKTPRFTLIESAIAAFDGNTTLHLCDNAAKQARGSSSIHQPTGHLQHFPWCTFEMETEVRAVTLDTLIAGQRGWVVVPIIDLLWVDIQGAERSCILGGTETLKRTRFIMIEAESVEMYEGQALKPELLALLPDFEVVEDLGYNVFLRRKDALSK